MQTYTMTVTFKGGNVRVFPNRWEDAIERMQNILSHHADEIASIVVVPGAPRLDLTPNQRTIEAAMNAADRKAWR